MSFQSLPIINGCYLDTNNEMFKVRMVSYYGKNIKEIVIEDTYGNIRSMDISNWRNLRLIPCCYSGSENLPLSPITA